MINSRKGFGKKWLTLLIPPFQTHFRAKKIDTAISITKNSVSCITTKSIAVGITFWGGDIGTVIAVGGYSGCRIVFVYWDNPKVHLVALGEANVIKESFIVIGCVGSVG